MLKALVSIIFVILKWMIGCLIAYPLIYWVMAYKVIPFIGWYWNMAIEVYAPFFTRKYEEKLESWRI